MRQGQPPLAAGHRRRVIVYSSRARGDEPGMSRRLLVYGEVFPVCAGMSPSDPLKSRVPHGFPRMRGDEPWRVFLYASDREFSRIRGDEPHAHPFCEGNGQCSLHERG